MIGVCGRGQRARLPERLAAVGAGRVGLGDVGRVGVEVEVVVGYRPGLGRHQAELDVGLLRPARISRADFPRGLFIGSGREGAPGAGALLAMGGRAAHEARRASYRSDQPLVESATGQIGHWSRKPVADSTVGSWTRTGHGGGAEGGSGARAQAHGGRASDLPRLQDVAAVEGDVWPQRERERD